MMSGSLDIRVDDEDFTEQNAQIRKKKKRMYSQKTLR